MSTNSFSYFEENSSTIQFMFSWSGFRMNLSMTNAKVWIASEPTVIITLEIPYLLSNDYKDWFTGDLREFKFRHYLTVIPHHVGYMPIFRNRMNLLKWTAFTQNFSHRSISGKQYSIISVPDYRHLHRNQHTENKGELLLGENINSSRLS